MMDHRNETDRLSEYVDGGLDAGERARVERHLADCGDCARLADELRAVAAEAAALPEVLPVRDLWPGIQGRLTPRRAARSVPARRAETGQSTVGRPWSQRRLMITVPQLLAAGLAVASVSAGAVWATLGGPTGAGAAAGTVATAPEPASPGVVLAAYEPGMVELEAEYARRRDELDPETIRVVERSLAMIDAAIQEASEALAADPSSGFLNTRLADAMRMRMTLLRQASSI